MDSGAGRQFARGPRVPADRGSSLFLPARVASELMPAVSERGMQGESMQSLWRVSPAPFGAVDILLPTPSGPLFPVPNDPSNGQR
jgi:hypothetical protein